MGRISSSSFWSINQIHTKRTPHTQLYAIIAALQKKKQRIAVNLMTSSVYSFQFTDKSVFYWMQFKFQLRYLLICFGVELSWVEFFFTFFWIDFFRVFFLCTESWNANVSSQVALFSNKAIFIYDFIDFLYRTTKRTISI